MELNYSGSGTVYYNGMAYKCDLYLNKEKGGILVKISVENAFASFLEIPVEIESLVGELSTGYKFLLLNCYRENTNGLVSENRTVFSYIAKFMIEGIDKDEYEKIKFYKVSFELSNIIEWGAISGYNIGENGQLMKNNECEKILYECNNYIIKYHVIESMLPVVQSELLREKIELQQKGYIDIIFENNEELNSFISIMNKVKRLIEFSTLENVSINKIVGWNKEIYNVYGDQKYEKPITIISSILNKKENKEKNDVVFKKWKWFILPELLEYGCIENYFDKYEKIEPIVDLYIQIIISNEMSCIGVFLNVVQALETYHSRFKASSLKEYKKRIDECILKDRPKNFCEEDRKFLIAESKKYVTLESRLADLITADFQINFDTGDILYREFPNIIASTRNYYVHYDERIKKKNRVLKKKEIAIYNRTLIYMLEYYIFIELGFNNLEVIKSKLEERWGKISKTLDILKTSENIIKNNKT